MPSLDVNAAGGLRVAGTKVSRMDASPEITRESHLAPWPVLDKAAYFGIAGEVAELIDPHTEADPTAILVQFLAAFGNAVGASPHYLVESARQTARLFVVLCGESSKARKGSSWAHVRRLMRLANPEWAPVPFEGGLSSGEGLIYAVRDPSTAKHPVKDKNRVIDYEDVVEDFGIDDKRLLVIEPEFASPVRRMAREGNTLSTLLRESWDSGDLRVMTTGRKQSPLQATGAHISVIAHTTRHELLRVLGSTEYGNGFANRFLWVCVKRSKVLPHGGNLEDVDLEPLGHRIRRAIESATGRGRLRLDDEADALWCDIYPELSEGESGLLGAITARAEAQTIRLALIYALLDSSDQIRLSHLRAALAVWKYCHVSVRCIFWHGLRNPLEESLLAAIRDAGPEGLTQTSLHAATGRNQRAEQLAAALRALEESGRIVRTVTAPSDKRRPTTRFSYVGTNLHEVTNLEVTAPTPAPLNSSNSLNSSLNCTQISIQPLPCSTCCEFDCDRHPADDEAERED